MLVITGNNVLYNSFPYIPVVTDLEVAPPEKLNWLEP